MDVLSDVLRAVQLTGAVFFDMESHSPWVGTTPEASVIAGIVMPEAEHIICFHALVAGSCWVELTDRSDPAIRLEAGDIVVIPKGDAHVLSSSPGLRGDANMAAYHRPPGQSLPMPHVLNEGAKGGEVCRFVCGYFGCDVRPFNPLLDALPRLFHARISSTSQNWLSGLVRVGVNESERSGGGREIMLAKLAELMFVEVVRKHIDSQTEDARGWFSGLRDHHIGTALQLIHARPAEAWTLEGLARQACLSRSVFAERFAHYVGVPPMQYLGRWRMQLATRLLERNDLSIAKAAVEVGYESEAAFNRAFKRFVGMPPGAWRRGRDTRLTQILA
jgi:AraC-like DNA-binding protein